jgi:short subunit dehydrogenase-like uncharacterized protein
MLSKFLLYGASGYTGSLIARLAVKRGLRSILFRRDPQWDTCVLGQTIRQSPLHSHTAASPQADTPQIP